MVTVIDGQDAILGRLASIVAERIMDGEEIVVVNAEKVVVTGTKEVVFAKYKHRLELGDITRRKGPFYPRRADLLFKRTVKGMIPRNTTTGRESYRNLHAFVGIPEEFSQAEKERPELAMRKISGKYTTLGAVSKYLGSNIR
jgi:large subunit ribosomal protein L13